MIELRARDLSYVCIANADHITTIVPDVFANRCRGSWITLTTGDTVLVKESSKEVAELIRREQAQCRPDPS